MRAKVLSVITVVDASGPEMDRGETVTVFNDLVVLAPGAIVDAPVRWTALDAHRVRGVFTDGDQTVSAELTFDADHDLVDFVSEDRLRASPDGRSFERQTWSTPLAEHRDADGRRILSFGEGRWQAPDPEGQFTYVEFHIDDIAYNEARPRPGTPVGTSRCARPDTMTTRADPQNEGGGDASVDLYWLPLGAGDPSRCVRGNGLVYEALVAAHQRQPRADLYHSALIVRLDGHAHAIEMAPVWALRPPTAASSPRDRSVRRPGAARDCSATRSAAGATGASRTRPRRSTAPDASAPTGSWPARCSTWCRPVPSSPGVATNDAPARCGTPTR